MSVLTLYKACKRNFRSLIVAKQQQSSQNYNATPKLLNIPAITEGKPATESKGLCQVGHTAARNFSCIILLHAPAHNMCKLPKWKKKDKIILLIHISCFKHPSQRSILHLSKRTYVVVYLRWTWSVYHKRRGFVSFHKVLRASLQNVMRLNYHLRHDTSRLSTQAKHRRPFKISTFKIGIYRTRYCAVMSLNRTAIMYKEHSRKLLNRPSSKKSGTTDSNSNSSEENPIVNPRCFEMRNYMPSFY